MKKINEIPKYVKEKVKESYVVLMPETFTDLFLGAVGFAAPTFTLINDKFTGTITPIGEMLKISAPFAVVYVAKKVRESHIKKKQKMVSEEFMNKMIDELNEKGALIEKPDKYDGRRAHSADNAPENSCFSDGVIDLQLRPQTSYRKEPEIGYSLSFRGNTSLEEIMQTKATFGKSKGIIDYIQMTTWFPEDTANGFYNAVKNYSEMRRKFKNETDKVAELQSKNQKYY